MRTHRYAVSLLVAIIVGCQHDPNGVGGDGFAEGGPGGDDDGSSSAADDEGTSADDGGGDVSSGASAPDDASGGDSSSESGAVTTAPSDTGGETTSGDDLGSCSNFVSVDQFFSWVNTERGQYGGMFGGIAHDRWKGYPWEGEYHTNYTFSTQFTWDDALAASAQTEADALASGAAPEGHQQNGSNGLQFCPAKPFWIAGINTGSWKISAAEYPEDWMPPPDHPDSCPAPFALAADNQHARMGLHYHDFGGDGPAIHRVGVGAAVGPDCQVWWVLQFGE